MRTLATLIVVFIVMALVNEIQACELDKMGNGCRIHNAQCSCGYGCKSEYRYQTVEDCKLALAGERNNACNTPSRCLHDGICLQVTSHPGYKCLCEGTGYFGIRCEKPCPGPENPHYKGPFPYECVVI